MMDDLMKCLYELIMERRMGALELDQEYRDSVRTVSMQEKKLWEQLNEDQRQEVELLMMEVTNQNIIEREYLFRASLALARELNALVRA